MSLNPNGYKLSDKTGKLTAHGKLYNINIPTYIERHVIY